MLTKIERQHMPLKGRLWTAPVWLNYPSLASVPPINNSAEIYYWRKSSTSKVYHKRDCSSVKMIKSENIEQGTTPPAGRTLHTCNKQEEEH